MIERMAPITKVMAAPAMTTDLLPATRSPNVCTATGKTSSMMPRRTSSQPSIVTITRQSRTHRLWALTIANPAVSAVYDRGIVSRMFADVATGRLTPEQALDAADREERAIYGLWRERGQL